MCILMGPVTTVIHTSVNAVIFTIMLFILLLWKMEQEWTLELCVCHCYSQGKHDDVQYLMQGWNTIEGNWLLISAENVFSLQHYWTHDQYMKWIVKLGPW
jgi:hypothetical protein